MKKFLVSFSLVLAIAFVGCNKNGPKDVAQNWLTSFLHLDIENAKKFSTDDTKMLLSEIQQLTDKVSDSSKKEMKKITVNIKNVKENGNKAVATYTTSDVPNKEQTINLVKQGDKWLVQFSKVDLMGGAPGEGSEEAASDSTSANAPIDSAMADTTRH